MSVKPNDIEQLDTDILVIGSGGAGLFATLHAHQISPGLKITLAVKGLVGKCGCTRMVQGGYNVALSPGDSVERHFMDTINGGKWLPDQDLAWKLCQTAVTRVQELENELGCFFDRNRDGSLHHKAFAGQTFDRTVHKGDLTGIEIINRLMERIRSLPINMLEEHRVVGLIPNNSGDVVAAALMVDMRSGRFRLVRARSILLASGGGPTMYRYHTPSGDKSMDGLAMALRLGLPLRDMEMVQFHPTGLLAGIDTRMTGTVLEEGLRGSGGHLLNGAGERFMQGYDPEAERATRDIVSRAIFNEMREGRTTPHGGVYISMSHLGPALVAEKFPGMVKRCADCGFDLAGGRVEVVPTAHYFMGGIVCNTDTETAIAGLYVAGEDAGGVHGANRLGGNGVANSTVFGGVAGEIMAVANPRSSLHDPDQSIVDREIERAMRPFYESPGDLNAIRERLMDTMWDNVGIVRTREGLEQGLQEILGLSRELMGTGLGQQQRVFNLSWHDWINTQSLLDISEVICRAALAREDSCGAHFREDFPHGGNIESSYFTLVQKSADNLEVARENVTFSIIRPGQSLLESE